MFEDKFYLKSEIEVLKETLAFLPGTSMLTFEPKTTTTEEMLTTALNCLKYFADTTAI